jgi:hypothetical protein
MYIYEVMCITETIAYLDATSRETHQHCFQNIKIGIITRYAKNKYFKNTVLYFGKKMLHGLVFGDPSLFLRTYLAIHLCTCISMNED